MNLPRKVGAATIAALALSSVLAGASVSAQILSATDKVTARQALAAGKSKNIIRERLPILGGFPSESAVRDHRLKVGQVRDYVASFNQRDVVEVQIQASDPTLRIAVIAPSADFPLFAGDVGGGSRTYTGIANRTSDYTIRVFRVTTAAAPQNNGERKGLTKSDAKQVTKVAGEARYLLSVARR